LRRGEQRGMSKGQVLLVSGDPDVTRTLQVYLDAHQFSVQVVSGGHEALAACRRSPPDAVILDWNLPDFDGYHLCQQLRAAEGMLDSLILVLLYANERGARLAALEAGADDVQALPIDIEEVRLRIEEVLRH
jgi:two-component system alkaline phosphatase synthesis response regulator PhoP